IPYFVYLVSLWYFTGMMRLPAAFVGSVACWGISAWVLIICWIKLH
ncbi:TPA: GlpM family protein, partial [Escherichia coli]|nr:GlpM family protein [Escherichia coli]